MFRVIFKRSSPIGLLLTVVLVMLGVRAFRRATGEMYARIADREKQYQAYQAQLDAEFTARRAAAEEDFRALHEDHLETMRVFVSVSETMNLVSERLEALEPEDISHAL